jgi:drug/metabolite transporter (DMT)-like permease
VTLALSRILLRGTQTGPQVLLGVAITVAGIALLLVGR